MNVADILQQRRTVHSYRPEPIPESALSAALLAAHHATNHKLTFPWRFTVVGPIARGRLADLAVELARKKPDDVLADGVVQATRAKITNPAVLVVASCVKSADPATAREDYAAVSCAIQNLMLSLSADGIGSKWSTGKVTTHTRTYELLGIDVGVEEIVGFVWAGVPDGTPSAPSRPPIESVVRRVE